jgi:segregation and condensation protein A
MKFDMEELATLGAEIEKPWTEQGPEFLVALAQKGEIDPWDVDLVFVIDKFLGQLSAAQSKQELKEAARIIFFVSVLLRLKSQKLYTKPIQEADDLNEPYGDLLDFEEIDFQEIDRSNNFNQLLNPKALDKALARNPKSLKEARKRSITLDDLITLFRETEVKLAQDKKKKKKKSLQDFEDEGDIILREDEETDIMELAHDENLEHKIQLLSEYILQTLELHKQTSLTELRDAIGDWVDTFLSALFLSHSGKTEISQKTFYQEIWLKRIA